MNLEDEVWFPYSPLSDDPEAIRLVTIKAGFPRSRLICTLTERSLASTSTVYSALSYTWGSPTEPRFISLNGHQFHVQENLFQALKCLRQVNEDVTLWADAICIDQFKMEERTHQVGVMSRIFQSAQCVHAWLGPTDADSEALSKCLMKDYSLHWESSLQPRLMRRLRLRDEGDASFRKLCSQAYWRRAWIRQELLFAKQITLHWGCAALDWDMFSDWYMNARVGLRASIYQDNIVDNYVGDRYIFAGYNVPHLTLESALRGYGLAECTDLRDRVYSLLALSCDCQGEKAIVADYRLNPAQLYFAVLNFCQPKDTNSFARHMREVLQVTIDDLFHLLKMDPMLWWNHSERTTTTFTLAHEYFQAVHTYLGTGLEVYLGSLDEHNASIYDVFLELAIREQRIRAWFDPAVFPRVVDGLETGRITYEQLLSPQSANGNDELFTMKSTKRAAVQERLEEATSLLERRTQAVLSFQKPHSDSDLSLRWRPIFREIFAYVDLANSRMPSEVSTAVKLNNPSKSRWKPHHLSNGARTN